VEAVTEVEVGPAVGGGDGLVHLDVEVTELLDVGSRFVGIGWCLSTVEKLAS
jgi:hypothetical protein